MRRGRGGVRFPAGRGFPGIIRYVPSRPLEMECAVGNQLVKFSRTVFTRGQGRFRDFLKNLFGLSTLFALVLVNRHDVMTSSDLLALKMIFWL